MPDLATPERLAAMVAEATALLDAASGAAAVCTWSRAGIPVPAIKLAEGRWAALRAVERRTRRGHDLDEVLDDELRTWEAALASLRERGAGVDWVAYRTGGVEALQDLRA